MKAFWAGFSILCLVSCVSHSTKRKVSSLTEGNSYKSTAFENNNSTVFEDLKKKYSEVTSLQTAGPDGKMFFYYLDSGDREPIKNDKALDDSLWFNFMECDKHSVVEKKSDCTVDDKKMKFRMPYAFAKASMKFILNLYLRSSDMVQTKGEFEKLKKFLMKFPADSADQNTLMRYREFQRKKKDAAYLDSLIEKFLDRFDARLRSARVDAVGHVDYTADSAFLFFLQAVLKWRTADGLVKSVEPYKVKKKRVVKAGVLRYLFDFNIKYNAEETAKKNDGSSYYTETFFVEKDGVKVIDPLLISELNSVFRSELKRLSCYDDGYRDSFDFNVIESNFCKILDKENEAYPDRDSFGHGVIYYHRSVPNVFVREYEFAGERQSNILGLVRAMFPYKEIEYNERQGWFVVKDKK